MDLYKYILDEQSEKLESIRSDVKDIKLMLASTQVEQAKCESRWTMLNKLGIFLGSGVSLGGLYSAISGWFNHSSK